MSISRSHTRNATLIDSLRELLNDDTRTAINLSEIYLDSERCPSGMIPCDESKETCPSPEFRVEPGIYTKAGNRCYTKQGVQRTRKLSEDDKKVAVKGLRALVIEVSKLRDMNTEIDRILEEGSKKSDEADAPDIPSSKYTKRGTKDDELKSLEENPVEVNPEKIEKLQVTPRSTIRTVLKGVLGVGVVSLIAYGLSSLGLSELIDANLTTEAWNRVYPYLQKYVSPETLTSLTSAVSAALDSASTAFIGGESSDSEDEYKVY